MWEEAVPKGKAIGAADAAYLEKSAKELKFIKVSLTKAEKTLAQKLNTEESIDWAEVEVLAVAKRRKALAVLDDKDARTIALGLGIKHVGSVGVLYEAFLHKLISYDEMVELLEKLGKVAWVSPSLLVKVIRSAKEVDK